VLLDELVPRWQFSERHAIEVHATPARVYDAILNVTPREIRFFRALTAVRRLGRGGGESILNAPPDEPLIATATRTGFRVLGEDVPREIVIALDITPQTLAAMNFRFEAPRLSTETRVLTRTTRARLAFGLYWFAIRAGSGLIRLMWLRAIKRRAERGL
jgi:hypothetical protein